MTGHDTLTDHDMTAYVDDLRSRIAVVEIEVPDVDTIIGRAPGRLRARHRAPLGHRMLAAVAVAALIGGVAVVLTRDRSTPVSVTGDERERDPFAGVVLLGPPRGSSLLGATIGAAPELEDPDTYDGTLHNYLGGTTGGRAIVVTLAAAPSGTRRPSFEVLAPTGLSLRDWFRHGLEGLPVRSAGGSATVAGATDARYLAVGRDDGQTGTTSLIVAHGARVDAVLAVSGMTPDDAEGLAARLHLSGEDATLDTTGLSLTELPSTGTERTSPLYSISDDADEITATPLPDAAFAIAALHQQSNNTAQADDPTLTRGAPDWLLSIDEGRAVAGVRDGQWVRITQRDPSRGTPTAPADRLAALRPLDRAKFEDAVAADPRNRAGGDTDTAAIAGKIGAMGRWIPTKVPGGVHLTGVAYTTSAGSNATPGLPPLLWNPTSGAVVFFTPDSGPFGVVVTSVPIGDRTAAFYRVSGDVLLAQVWETAAPTRVVMAHSRGIAIDGLSAVLSGLRHTADGWSMTTPDGWEVVAAPDATSAPSSDADGYILEFGRESVWILPGAADWASTDLVAFMQTFTVTRQTVDGRTLYAGVDPESGRASVIVPGDADRPTVEIPYSRLPVHEAIDLALSVDRTDAAGVASFVATIEHR